MRLAFIVAAAVLLAAAPGSHAQDAVPAAPPAVLPEAPPAAAESPTAPPAPSATVPVEAPAEPSSPAAPVEAAPPPAPLAQPPAVEVVPAPAPVVETLQAAPPVEAPAVVAPPPPVPPHPTPKLPASPDSDAAAQATAVVAAFHESLRENYRKGVLNTLAPDVAIFEQGYTESSREVYGGGHLDSDLLFAASTRYEVIHREAAAHGDMAWVITQARTTGTFAGQAVDIDNTETAVLERRGGRWQIVHLHWSAHPRGE
ncbi:MAG: nuclear transport factor 2 family protein [Solimonas sp.]